MKIIVLGGYGVFGSRLVRLLIRDGHEAVIAGRNTHKARSLADELGCMSLTCDRQSNPNALFDVSPDVVVDAAGPFQAYGADPYTLPRLCLARGADYLDLSDDADFTAGLGALDREARQCGRRLLSGASSVPGISSSVAAELCRGLEEILLIDTAILPGNRAPRGASVMASIIAQLGTASQVWRGGVWRDQHCWSDPACIRLACDMRRTARFIEVPDIRLFPAFFKARSVMFRAGMELRALNLAMQAITTIRRRWRFDLSPRRVEMFRTIARLLEPLGTDRGGMRVAVVGRNGDVAVRREWRLIAEAGDGPFVPAIAARAVIRRLDRVSFGARPCLAEATLAEIEEAMADLAITTSLEETPCPPMFQSALADRWAGLPPEIQALHRIYDVESFSGTAQVMRGKSIFARLAARLFGFPPAADEVAVTVTKTRTGDGETWERNFGGRVFRSRCTPAPEPYRFRERFGAFNFELELLVQDEQIRLPVRRGWFMGLPLPVFLLPGSESREYRENGVFCFDVALLAPLGVGLIVRYQGELRPDRSDGRFAAP